MSLAATLLTPLLAFSGALLGVALSRRSARELESRSLREETMRNVRWAAELALEPDDVRWALGMSQLEALDESKVLEPYEHAMARAPLSTLIPIALDDEET